MSPKSIHRLSSVFAAGLLCACGSGSLDTGMNVAGGPDAAPVDTPDAAPVADAAPVEPDDGIPAGRVTKNLVALYTFVGTAGQTTIPDVSGVGTPLDLTITNPAAAQWTEEGVVFAEPNLAQSAGPATKINEACAQSNAITLEAWVRSDNLELVERGRVVSISVDTGNRNADMAQLENEPTWNFRLRTDETNNNGTNPSTSAAEGSVSGELQHVVYVRQGLSELAQSYVNGNKQIPTIIPGLMTNWDLSYPINIGNEATQDRPFIGEIDLVAVYCGALTQTEVRQNYDAGP